jgi:ribosomal protein S18 acetylase RimI-like enzyme
MYMTGDTAHQTVRSQLFWWWLGRPFELHPYVVTDNGLLAGYAIIKWSPIRGWLTAGLFPECRGRGLGTEVFADLVAKVERMKKVPALMVRESNGAAKAVYEKLGFVATSTDGAVTTMEKR